MYLAYCLIPVADTWTPPVHLDTAADCLRYCVLHHRWAPEIRITDEDDFVVLHVVDHVLKCPMPDGSLRETPLAS